VFDRNTATFMDTARRDALLADLGLQSVPVIGRGTFTMEDLRLSLLEPSRVGTGHLEGIVVRRESGGITVARATLVRAEFTQAIEAHWSRRPLRRNTLAAAPRGP